MAVNRAPDDAVEAPGTCGRYFVTRDGRVWSAPNRLHDGKWLTPALRKGYLFVTPVIDGRAINYSVHRMVALAYVPNPCDLPQVNHKNGDKTDNRAENLEWCSARANTLHAHRSGLVPTTSAMRSARAANISATNRTRRKLTPDQVQHIRRETKNGRPAVELARAFGIHRASIHDVVKRRSYGEIE